VLHLQAHDNQIVTISKDLGKLSNLTKLDLSHNKIRLVPEELGDLRRLTELKISHNSLEEVPGTFGSLSSLRILVGERMRDRMMKSNL
jgi:Leucine-rich repeat (LRR) protein